MTVIGAFDQKLVFEAVTVIADGYGGGASQWNEQALAWASVKPVSAREGERQGAERGGVIYMVECWRDGLDDVTEASRIRWCTSPGDIYLNIREIRRPPKRGMQMVIMAESGVTQ